MPQIKAIHEYRYSVDVLTDGSEYSGDGSVFLSVYRAKKPTSRGEGPTQFFKGHSGDDDVSHLGDLIVRYCISGVGDCTSRLAADQKFKLGSTKAVFPLRHRGLLGLSSLLYALRESGSDTLTVVSANAVDSLVESVTRSLSHPKIQLCQVPSLCQSCNTHNYELQSSTPDNETKMPWWMVYQDMHIKVHARRVNPYQDSDKLLFFYTLTPPNGCKTPLSFLVLPPGATLTKTFDWPHDEDTDQPLCCEFILYVGWKPAFMPNIAHKYFWTTPRENDPRLLSRSYRQSLSLHNEAPKYFPFRHVGKDEPSLPVADNRLLSAYSLIWKQIVSPDEKEKLWTSPIVRVPPIDKGDHEGSTGFSDEEILISSLNTFVARPYQQDVPRDDNEIDLDDDDESDGVTADTDPIQDLESSVGQLLVLGTGCASPSPYRGASGHVLFGNDKDNEWALVLEAGEGFVTQWHRYATKPLSLVSVIWISHSHWDHYGGLAQLLWAIAQYEHNQEPSEKRQKTMHRLRPPLVLAPRKVLNFLHSAWPETHSQYFRGIPHEDLSPKRNEAWDEWNYRFVTPRIQFWDNVLVDHSCRNAFGCIVGLRQDGNTEPFVLVFSGDTRPCPRLVQACRRRVDCVDFLIHEATFEDTDVEMSIQKKHSTVSEALGIASQINANKVLLTHFSQRYSKVPTNQLLSSGNISRRKIALALDGMLIPLYK